MIDIYTDKKESKDWILQNDLYFNLNTGNEEMSQNEINLIQQVDEARLTPDKHIETKYGLGTIRNLSSGCKTLLNIVKHPDSFIVVDNADNLMNDEVRSFINFEPSNQYMLFLRNCDGLNVSNRSFKVLKFDNNRITLEEEL